MKGFSLLLLVVVLTASGARGDDDSDNARSGARRSTVPIHMVIVCDAGKDLDDEITLVLARSLTDAGLVRVEAVVAVLAPSSMRARLARGTLDQLEIDVPTGIGSNCTVEDTGESDHEFEDIPYLAEPSELENGTDLLLRVLGDAADESIVWLLLGGLTDPAELLQDHEELFLGKTRRVVVMGGVETVDGEVRLDQHGHMLPDSAANNMFDKASADFLYRRLQELGVPMTVLTREAAYAVQVPRDHYDHMAETAHPVGVKIRNTQRRLIEALWRRAHYPIDDPRREKLPARCDPLWFCDTFCGGQGTDRTGNDPIWDLITGFNMYDPMACVAAIPSLRARFFDPVRVPVNGVEHEIIGVSSQQTGIADENGLRAFVTRNTLTGLQAATAVDSRRDP